MFFLVQVVQIIIIFLEKFSRDFYDSKICYFRAQLFTRTRQTVHGTDAVEMMPVVPSVSDEKLEKERKRKADLAAKRRLRIMAQMATMQKEFIRENSELFESTSCELQPAGSDMDIR